MRLLKAALLSLVALLGVQARAGQFAVSFDTSQYSVAVRYGDGTNFTDYLSSNTWECGGSFPNNNHWSQTADVSASGTVTANIQWTNASDGEPAPQYAIVIEYGTVSSYGWPTTDADDGLGDGLTFFTAYSALSFGYHISVVPVGANGSITRHASPSGEASYEDAPGIELYYEVWAYPIRVLTTGTSSFGSASKWDPRILVGQSFTSTFDTGTLLTDFPQAQYPQIYSALNIGAYSWSFPSHIYTSYAVAADGSSAQFNDVTNQQGVTGNTCTYKYSIQTPSVSTTLGGTGSSWNPATLPPIKCSTTICGVQVVAWGYITVEEPDVYHPSLATNNPDCGVVTLVAKSGDDLSTYVNGSGQPPFGFTLFGAQCPGTDGLPVWEGILYPIIVGVNPKYVAPGSTDYGQYGFVQIITSTTKATLTNGGTQTLTATAQLDNNFPYLDWGNQIWAGCNNSINSDGTVGTGSPSSGYYWFEDTPGFTPLPGQSDVGWIRSATLNDHMSCYVFFQPPLASTGGVASYVPVYLINWQALGSANQDSSGNWTSSDGLPIGANGAMVYSKKTSVGPTGPTDFPIWTSIFHNTN